MDKHLKSWSIKNVQFDFFQSQYTLFFQTKIGEEASLSLPSELIDLVRTNDRHWCHLVSSMMRTSLEKVIVNAGQEPGSKPRRRIVFMRRVHRHVHRTKKSKPRPVLFPI